MSQIEPYDYSQFPPDDDDEFEPMQMRGGSWQPGWRPPHSPGPRPPHGPPWPPGPGHGGWPFWGYWGFRLRSAWRDVKFLNRLIGDIVNEQIDNGIIAPGPNYVPPSGTTPTPSPGIKGVTDGSDAGPGQVGEFVTGTATLAYTANANTTGAVSPIVMQPGDWDINSTVICSSNPGGVHWMLNPVPTGVSNDLQGWTGELIGGGGTSINPGLNIGRSARGSFSVPTLLAFSVTINNSTNPTLPAGTATLTVEARRRR